MNELTKILYVAVGGAVGAVLRYLINISPLAAQLKPFPFHTFIINIGGSFALGLLTALFAERFPAAENMRLLITVGLLGALTTFSTFELETLRLIEEKYLLTAILYVAASFSFGLFGVSAGLLIGKKISEFY